MGGAHLLQLGLCEAANQIHHSILDNAMTGQCHEHELEQQHANTLSKSDLLYFVFDSMSLQQFFVEEHQVSKCLDKTVPKQNEKVNNSI